MNSATLLALLPLLVWVELFQLAREAARRGRIPADWRVSWALAGTAWGALVTLSTELTSFAGMLDPRTITILWIGMALGLGLGLRKLLHARGTDWRALLTGGHAAISNLKSWPLENQLMCGFAAVLALALGVMAVAAATNNWDSLTYHLPRVMHWIQQGSVDHYPTGNTRQIEFAPWSAYVLTHLHLLTGGDLFDGLLQWYSMVSTAIAASYIAEHALAAAVPTADDVLRQRAAILAALLVVTLPIGIVEATTPQTDYNVTGWLLTATILALELKRAPQNRPLMVAAALALSLGVLTKTTMFLYAAPLVLGLGAWLVAKARPQFWKISAVVVAVFFVINGPHFTRNTRVFGSPLGSTEILAWERNERLSPAVTLSNVLRNLVLHAQVGFPVVSGALQRLLMAAHDLTGLDANDPRTTFPLSPFSLAVEWQLSDSFAPCAVHLLLALAACLLAFRLPVRQWWFAAAPAGAFLLICTVLKWQFWGSRLHLAVLALLMPWIAGVLCAQPCRAWRLIAIALATGSALMTVALNETRPLFQPRFWTDSREEQFFAYIGRKYFLPWRQCARDVAAARCSSVGLQLSFDKPEYPLWEMLRANGFTGRIAHFRPGNPSGLLRRENFFPDVIITSDLGEAPEWVRKIYPRRTDYGKILAAYWRDRTPGPTQR